MKKFNKVLLLTFSVPMLVHANETNLWNSFINLFQSSDKVEHVKQKAESFATDKVQTSTKEFLENYFNHVEFGVNSIGGQNGPEIELITTRAYDDDGKKNGFLFNQLGLLRYDGDTTLNVGLGYRQLSDDQMWMYGVNGFYDRELNTDHDRTSVGAEVASSVFRANYNAYQGQSDWITHGGVTEKALDGTDYNVFVKLPYLPTSEFRVNGFKWDGVQSAADLKGRSYSLITDLDNLRIEAGRTDYDSTSGRVDDNFVTAKYVYPFGTGASKESKVSSKAYVFKKIDDKTKYAPVKRQNRIIKQKKFAATVSGV